MSGFLCLKGSVSFSKVIVMNKKDKTCSLIYVCILIGNMKDELQYDKE